MKLSEAFAKYETLNECVESLAGELSAFEIFENGCPKLDTAIEDREHHAAAVLAAISAEDFTETSQKAQLLLARAKAQGKDRADTNDDPLAATDFALLESLVADLARLTAPGANRRT